MKKMSEGKKLYLVIDQSTSGGQCVGEGFYVGNDLQKIIKTIQKNYKNCCAEFKFCVYIVKLDEPFSTSDAHVESQWEPFPDAKTNIPDSTLFEKIQLGTQEVFNTLSNTFNDDHIYFPLIKIADDELMRVVPEKLFISDTGQFSLVISSKFDSHTMCTTELVPNEIEKTVLYGNNY